MVENVLVSAAGLCLATIIGSLIGFCFKSVSHKWNDIILGFCAGIMLSAAVLGCDSCCRRNHGSCIPYAYRPIDATSSQYYGT